MDEAKGLLIDMQIAEDAIAQNSRPSGVVGNLRSAASSMVLMRGLPGSGKSHKARELVKDRGGVVVSADDFFIGSDGVYRHDRSRIRQAHADTQRRAAEAFARGCHLVVVDNTHMAHREMTDYFAVAAHHGATVELVEPNTPWAWDPLQCARRTVHGVPLEIVQTMLARYQPMSSAAAQAVVNSMRAQQ